MRKTYTDRMTVFISVLVFFIPYLVNGFVTGSQGMLHMARITSLLDAFDNAAFPTDLRPILLDSHGLGIGFFYPDALLVIPAAIMKIFGFEVYWAFKIYFFAFMCMSGWAFQDCLKKLFPQRKNKFVILTATVVLLAGNIPLWWSTYALGNIALSHALIVFPVAIAALFLGCRGRSVGWIRYGIFSYLTFMSVPIVYLLLVITSVVIVAVSAAKSGKLVHIWQLLFMTVVVLLMSIGFWLPALEQKSAIKFDNLAALRAAFSMETSGDFDTYISSYETMHNSDIDALGAAYLPSAVTTTSFANPDYAVADDESTSQGIKYDGAKWYDIWVVIYKEYYDMPYIYYKGYHAYLMDYEGELIRELEIEQAQDNDGLIRVYMPHDIEDEDGIMRVILLYEMTSLQKVAILINLVMIVAAIIVLYHMRNVNENKLDRPLRREKRTGYN